ncbi:MAG: tRNA glutamyl-Q(34) synthetase GluQRS [Oscillospiraceae bacterium]
MAQVKGRFAPTPSGKLHLGNVFSALLAWLSVRAQGGQMLLRIEDLDLARTSPAFTAAIIDDLAWLGLTWQEGPGREKGHAPYLQSRRTPFYEAQLAKLRALGLIYPCFCSRAELHAAEAPHLADGSYVYSGKCRALSFEEQARRAAAHPGATRVRVPNLAIGFTDGCQGPYEENLQQACGDFILRRSDGVFAYQLAAPADDGEMEVTEVVRGLDLLSSAPRQIWLMQTLGYPPPQYRHVPLLLAPDGRRLSKRDKDMDLAALRSRCQTPEPLLGFLACTAGLLPEPTPISAEGLVPFFSWAKVKKENIVLQPGFERYF